MALRKYQRGFANPTMPQVPAPTSPTASADAERKRQAAAEQAQIDATAGGRASTIVGGNDVAYRSRAGAALMRGGASSALGA